jgi:hypothetical protein
MRRSTGHLPSEKAWDIPFVVTASAVPCSIECLLNEKGWEAERRRISFHETGPLQ